MARTIVTLKDPNNGALPGEQKVFENVGAVMGGQQNALLTFFNEDPVNEHDGSGGPKPFFSIASNLVYSVETPENNRPPAMIALAQRVM